MEYIRKFAKEKVERWSKKENMALSQASIISLVILICEGYNEGFRDGKLNMENIIIEKVKTQIGRWSVGAD